ncbi:MAG: site-2 protease family protein [Rhodospirillaceae bacterium]|nr:site-2 protease family protein [Rhodospirillales bacterium]
MFAHRLPLFQLLGLQIRLHPSWFLLAALVLWSLGAGYFPYVAPGRAPFVYWIMAAAGVLGLAVSVVAHEMAHALVGRRFGMSIAGITLFVFGGVAELDSEPTAPQGEALMALAGPLFSVAASGLFYGLEDMSGGVTGVVLDYLGFLNLLLAGFNMLPAFPMDGGRVLRAALWAWRGDVVWATRWATAGAAVLGLGMMAVGVWQIVEGALAAGVWWLVVGFFVRAAAAQAFHRVVQTNSPVSAIGE